MAFTIPPLPLPTTNTKTSTAATSSPKYLPSSLSRLKMIRLDDDEKTQIRYLGKGERALVRPGVVLVAPLHEYSHWL